MLIDLTDSTLIRVGIFILLLIWTVFETRRQYVSKLSWKNFTFIILVTVLLTILAMAVTSIVLIMILQHWVSKETLETIVFVMILIVMYVVFKYLLKQLDVKLLKDNLSDDG